MKVDESSSFINVHHLSGPPVPIITSIVFESIVFRPLDFVRQRHTGVFSSCWEFVLSVGNFFFPLGISPFSWAFLLIGANLTHISSDTVIKLDPVSLEICFKLAEADAGISNGKKKFHTERINFQRTQNFIRWSTGRICMMSSPCV